MNTSSKNSASAHMVPAAAPVEEERHHRVLSPPLRSETTLRQLLPKVLSSFDFFANKQVVILWLVNAAGAAAGGPVALLYWVLGTFFYVPTVFATTQLAVIFPEDGALYSWTYRAFVSHTRLAKKALFFSSFVGTCFWLIGPLAFVIGANAFVSFLQGLLPASWQQTYLSQPWQQGVLMILLVLLSAFLITQRLCRLQRLINYTFLANLVALILISSAGVVWMMEGHLSATSFAHLSDWLPLPQSFGLFGLICLGYLGEPTVVTMIGEHSPSINVRSIMKMLLHWGSLLVIAGYLLSTWALLVVRGQAALASSTNSNFELVRLVALVFGKGAAMITVACLMLFVLVSPLLYNIASSRVQVMGSIDKQLPAFFQALSRDGVPARALWVQVLVAIFMLGTIFFLAPLFTSLGQPTQLATIVYNIVLATLTLIFMLATSFLFIDLFLILRSQRQYLVAQRLVPLPFLRLSMFVGIFCCALVSVDTLCNSWIPQLLSNGLWFLFVSLFLLFCIVFLIICSSVASGETASQRLLQTDDTDILA
jgi:amino acid transporter